MLDKSELWLPPSYKPNRSSLRIRRASKAVYRWTGLPGKTLWDTFQLLGVLAIPVVVVIASNMFSFQLNQANLRANEQQHQTDIQIATDQQRETTLQNYLETMSGLLLNNQLLQSRPTDAVREVARVQTLTTLRRLDPNRKVFLLRFLYEANLIGNAPFSVKNNPINIIPAIVSLGGADLSGANLSGANLSGVNLSGVDLSNANLSNANLNTADLNRASLIQVDLNRADLNTADLFDADLFEAHLSGTHLSGANLRFTILSKADLSDADLVLADLYDANLNTANLSGAHLNTADLSNADLSNADLSGVHLSNADLFEARLRGTHLFEADLSGADLSGADLSGAIISQQQLNQTKSLENAIMPDGTKHP